MSRSAILAEDEADAGELNVTPLVDVALVLVIIFMVTAPLLQKSALEVRLPKAASEETREPVQLAVTLARDGRLALNDAVLAERAVLAGVEAGLDRDPDALVVLRADAGIEAARVVELAKKLRAAGAARVAVGTETSGRAAGRKPWLP